MYGCFCTRRPSSGDVRAAAEERAKEEEEKSERWSKMPLARSAMEDDARGRRMGQKAPAAHAAAVQAATSARGEASLNDVTTPLPSADAHIKVLWNFRQPLLLPSRILIFSRFCEPVASLPAKHGNNAKQNKSQLH